MGMKVTWFEFKLVALATIWIPKYELESKLIISSIWLLKLLIDFSVHKFSSGYVEIKNPILKFLETKSTNFREVFSMIMTFWPSIWFEYVAMNKNMWLPTVVGGIALIVYGALVILVIKDIKKD